MTSYDAIDKAFADLQNQIDSGKLKDKYPQLEAVEEYAAKETWIPGLHTLNAPLACEYSSATELRNSDQLGLKYADSLKALLNDGSPAGGTGMQYFVGEFDGQKFIADSNQEKGLWIDYGKDFYAGVTWNHVPKDRRLMIAWADNWQYRDYLPTSPFKGQMSCVRELKLVQKEKKYILKQLPVKEMECLRTNKHEMKNIKMGADEEWTLCDKKEVLELDISYPIEKIHAQTFGIKISTGKNRQFEIVFCKEKQCCFVDRTTAGVNPHDKFAGKYKAPVDFTQEFLTIKLLMDVSQSELFINNGEVVMSNLLFPEDFYKVKLFATGGDLVIEKSIIYEMDEIMKHPLDEA